MEGEQGVLYPYKDGGLFVDIVGIGVGRLGSPLKSPAEKLELQI